MNVLVYRYGSICEPDLMETFEILGFHVDTIDAEITKKNLKPNDQLKLLQNALEQKDYAFVFTINFFPTLSAVLEIYKIPYLCWIVDSPVMELYSDMIQNSVNRIFLFDYALYEEFSPYNPSGIFYLPLATNIRRWKEAIHNATFHEQQKFACDVSFVGSLYTEKNPYSRFVGPDYLKGYFEGMIRAQERVYGAFFLEDLLTDELVSQFKKHLPGFYTFPEKTRANDRACVAQLYLATAVATYERIDLFSAIEDHYKLTLYTGSDTTPYNFKSKGRVKTLTEMPLVFVGSKINLNITAKPIRTGLPLRIWDILGCHGFMISNYQSEIPEFFTNEEDIVMYESIEHAIDLIGYYLDHDKKRKEIADAAYDKVCKFHTYELRVTQMLEMAFQL
ncbi:glycosyltransferase family protein [Eubacterium oxidoreducens]|uniref:Spore maturation protein CgeB n=1 Tax=Eubacterium oxidoreducens TaxID=1732 RepID=A0A1G6BS24_EUBOX|nr:DUF3880 domain-containing protein [Eubacterium oxidoreducens]SDB23412.1 spore maturation protein CgeB [Eubacterium oxidoreducens]